VKRKNEKHICVQSRRNKLVILYGLHEPLEPTSTIVERLKLPKNVIAIRHPSANTPRGVYTNTRQNIKKILSSMPDSKDILKRVCDRYNSMKPSFERYHGRIGDVINDGDPVVVKSKIDLSRYFITEHELIKTTVKKKSLTILVHCDVEPAPSMKRYYGIKKYYKFQKLTKSLRGQPACNLELELVFPCKYKLRDFETLISDTYKECLYKAYSLIGPCASKQHSWTYATQSYSVEKLKIGWIMKRVNALENLILQFVGT
jgi:hypothetical protein